MYRFFFFQAEDGIRDVAVTGVQTCALPISRHLARRLGAPPPRRRRRSVLPQHAASSLEQPDRRDHAGSVGQHAADVLRRDSMMDAAEKYQRFIITSPLSGSERRSSSTP